MQFAVEAAAYLKEEPKNNNTRKRTGASFRNWPHRRPERGYNKEEDFETEVEEEQGEEKGRATEWLFQSWSSRLESRSTLVFIKTEAMHPSVDSLIPFHLTDSPGVTVKKKNRSHVNLYNSHDHVQSKPPASAKGYL